MLGAVLMRPDYEYTLENLLDIAGTGRGNTQRQIERLIDAGVLREGQRRGRQRRIAANRSFFLYPELESVVRKTFGLAISLTAALKPFSNCIDEALVLGRAWPPDGGERDLHLVIVGTVCEANLQATICEVERRHGRRIHLHSFSAAAWLEHLEHDPIAASAAKSGERLPVGRTEPAPPGNGNSRALVGEPVSRGGFIPSLLGARGR